jgi:hypothetical protein
LRRTGFPVLRDFFDGDFRFITALTNYVGLCFGELDEMSLSIRARGARLRLWIGTGAWCKRAILLGLLIDGESLGIAGDGGGVELGQLG